MISGPYTKVCYTCKARKSNSEFPKNIRKKDGLDYRCLECSRIGNRKSYLKNREKVIARTSDRLRSLTPEKRREYTARYYDKHREVLRQRRKERAEKANTYSKIHYVNNKAMYFERSARRRAAKRLATPGWLAPDQIAQMVEIYKNCPKGYHVDHIVPLNNPNVCGLHVPWNLQYLPAAENRKKFNKLL